MSNQKEPTQKAGGWLIEYREWHANYGWTHKPFRICSNCNDARKLGNGTHLKDRFCPKCGSDNMPPETLKELMKIKGEA